MKHKSLIYPYGNSAIIKHDLIINKNFDRIPELFSKLRSRYRQRILIDEIGSTLLIRLFHHGTDKHIENLFNLLDKKYFDSLSIYNAYYLIRAAIENNKFDAAIHIFKNIPEHRKISVLKNKNGVILSELVEKQQHYTITNFFKSIADPRAIRDFLLSKNAKILRLAAHNRNVELIKTILTIAKNTYCEIDIIKTDEFHVLKASLNRGDLEIASPLLLRLRELNLLKEFLEQNDFEIFHTTCILEANNSFIQLFNYAKSINITHDIISSRAYGIIELCYEKYNKDLLRFLIKAAKDIGGGFWNSPVVFLYSYSAVLSSAQTNNTEVLKIMSEEIENPIFWYRILIENEFMVFRSAIECNSLDSCKILLDIYKKYNLVNILLEHVFIKNNLIEYGKTSNEALNYTALFAFENSSCTSQLSNRLISNFSNNFFTKCLTNRENHKYPGGLLRMLSFATSNKLFKVNNEASQRANLNLSFLHDNGVLCTSLLNYKRITSLLLPYSTAEYILMGSFLPREITCMIMANIIDIKIEGENQLYSSDFTTLQTLLYMKPELKFVDGSFPSNIEGFKTLNFIDKLETYKARKKPKISIS